MYDSGVFLGFKFLDCRSQSEPRSRSWRHFFGTGAVKSDSYPLAKNQFLCDFSPQTAK